MKKKTVAWLMIATFLVLAGCILFGGMMMALNWDFAKLSTVKYETNIYELTDTVTSIQIQTTTANTVFLPADDGVCKVVCYEAENEYHRVYVEDGSLTVRLVNEKKWYDYIGLHFGAPKVTVYLPSGLYETLSIDIRTGYVDIPKDFQFGTMDISGGTGDVTVRASTSQRMEIEVSTGNITLSDITTGSMDLKTSTGRITVSNVACEGDVMAQVSTGKITLSDVSCKNLTTKGNTGNLMLNNLIASEKITVHRTTGDVKLEACDAGEIYIETDTGNVTGTLLSDKIFLYKTSTGKVDLPQTTNGGRCEIHTSTGDICLKIIH